MASSQQTNATGLLRSSETWGRFNEIAFIIQQFLAKVQTATLVKIVACTNDGELSPFGFVDVQPLVNQIDGSNPPKAVPHATIYSLPYMRMQGGSSAVILDPQPGDIGIAVFASRDLSVIKNTQAQGNPGSLRSFDFADGMYLGGVLNGAPQQYIQFNSGGITIVSPETVKIKSADGTPLPVVLQPLITWITGSLLPALAAHGITVAPPPADSITATLEAS